MATAEQMALARRIGAEVFKDRTSTKAAVLAGTLDDTPAVQIALAAIIETTELAAKMADQWHAENKANAKDVVMDGAAIEMNAFRGALRNMDHLKGPDHA